MDYKNPLELERARSDPRARLKHVNHETKEALAELDKTYKGPELDLAEKKTTQKADKVFSFFFQDDLNISYFPYSNGFKNR